MFIEPFKLISFNQSRWKNNDFSKFFINTDTKDKVQKTNNILNFLKNMIAKGEAKIEQSPCIYVLNIQNYKQNVTSIIGSVHYNERNIFIPNENIHQDKLLEYKKTFDKYKIQVNPLLTFYKGENTISSLTESTTRYPPKIEADIDGSTYRLWSIKNPIDLETIKSSFDSVNKLYIADGHHRFAIFNNMPRKTSTKIMVSVTDANSICLKSCHKVIVGNISDNWIQKISKYCILEILDEGDMKNNILINFKDGPTYKVTFRTEVVQNMSLYYIVNNIIINEVFGIKDVENSVFPLPGTVSFSDSQRIFELYQNSSAVIFIPSIDVSEFFKIVDNGDKLPPTSTWFEPKIIDGFVIMNFG
ncbi:MAG: DUF1015 family protein [Holosporales bacterium]|jgi:uncharacterized protein (DUF1015 family)|nr:DUF1015 family protein [Holosporales bacterium]